MSVTFSIEANFTGDIEVTCWNEARGDYDVVATAHSPEEAQTERAAHMLLCSDCADGGNFTRAVMDIGDELDVNLANTNARMILSMLGFTAGGDDLAGSQPGETFLAATLVALGTERDDSGVASATYTGDGLATMIDCGIRPGYYGDTFTRLHALATEAVRLNRDIQWC